MPIEETAAPTVLNPNGNPQSGAPMAALIEEIVATHHAALRRMVPCIEAIAGDMIEYGARDDGAEGQDGHAGHEAMVDIRQLIGGLWACVQGQLDREERIAFPSLIRLEKQTQVSRCHAGMIRSQLMMAERDLARIRGVMMRLRELAEEILSPAGPCEICHELLSVIDALLGDLQEHTRKESQLLFPWAIAREAELAR
jgi:iron-sulfur cluster repair protein YtfE (RIC family)